MALAKFELLQSRAPLIALAIASGLAGWAATCAPASAQVYWGDSDRYPYGRHQQPQRDYFFPFFGDRYNRPPPVVDSSKAPPPRKLETPPATTVVVIGDSMADWLAYGLD